VSHLKQLLEVFGDQRLQLPSTGDNGKWAEALDTFLREWARWNDKVNLTAEGDAAAVIERHVFDSLQYVRGVQNPQGQVMDIGSGGGFPGIPLKVIFPELKFVLVESQRKRASFLRNCVRKMALADVEVLNQRAEDLNTDYLDRFDLVVFRGVGDILYCAKLAGPFLKMGGQVVIKKEPDAKPPEFAEQVGYKFQLQDEIPFEGGTGVCSKLMLFSKCST
jgi:16S rRNA (guanine527-N7)-methyltransferase